jgi:hypothetical protein
LELGYFGNAWYRFAIGTLDTMNIELPEHLKATADLLSRSLHLHSQDRAPAVPKSLVNDLTSLAAPIRAPRSRVSWITKIQSLVTTPGFGLAATALLVIGLFAPAMMTSQPQETASQETFRGANVTYSQSNAAIVLLTDNSETRQLMEESGLFDMSVVVETSDPMVAAELQSAKLLVDVKGGAIVGYNAQSREVLADQLPAESTKIAERIALAFGALQ